LRIVANSASQNGAVRHLSGNVTIESDAILLHADAVDLNDNAQEIIAHGDVRIKLK
jgi:lipopolysaccharide assembly outer membrane protein LptD (OstA)